MNRLLVFEIVVTAFLQLGQDRILDPRLGLQQYLRTIQGHVLKVAKINWKPISVFPEEAERFE
jgi:hypothetical protein